MNDLKHKQVHEEIDLLLPWYVNETLDPVEHERVAKHVESCPDCKASVALLSEVQAAVARDKATPIVPRPRVNDLLDSVNTRASVRRLDKWQATNYLVAAALTVVLVATLLIGVPDRPADVPGEYETATTSQGATSMDYVLRIQFDSRTSESERNRLLQDIGARDVSGGSAEGSYRVIVQLSAASLDELDRYTDSLESLPEVASVDVVALQLPMRPDQ